MTKTEYLSLALESMLLTQTLLFYYSAGGESYIELFVWFRNFLGETDLGK